MIKLVIIASSRQAIKNLQKKYFTRQSMTTQNGSYSSSLSVRVGNGEKYKFYNNYYIEIEGSYHKITRGYNSHDGYYNIYCICQNLIEIVNNYYDIELPEMRHWFLQRIDIAICYDLAENENVRKYINNLSMCQYPRRNIKTYQDESIYLTREYNNIKNIQ